MPPKKAFIISDPSAFRPYIAPTSEQKEDTRQGTSMGLAKTEEPSTQLSFRPSEATHALPSYLSSHTNNRYCIPQDDELAAVPDRITDILESEKSIRHEAIPNQWTWKGVVSSAKIWINFEVNIYNQDGTHTIETTDTHRLGASGSSSIHKWLVANIEELATNPQATATKLSLYPFGNQNPEPPMHCLPLPEKTNQADMTRTIRDETTTIGKESSPYNDETTKIGAIQKMIADTHPTEDRLDHRLLIQFILKNIGTHKIGDRDEDPYIYFSLRFLAIVSESVHYPTYIHEAIATTRTISKLKLFIAQDKDYQNSAAIDEAQHILDSIVSPNC